jgi:hypothetical protein
MIRNCLMIGFSAAALALSACDMQERSPTRSEPKAETGSARLALPKLPAGYLSDSGQKAWFSLSITGPGMDPILKTWSLSGTTAPPVLVAGIPAGMRAFRGRLLRVDPGRGDTTVTHEGVDSAYIAHDSVTEVRLYLKDAVLGSAHVCVEVEGWPADPGCIAPPPPVPGAAGCFTFQVAKPGPQGTRQDTLFRGRLRLDRTGGVLEAILDWGDGRMRRAEARVANDGVLSTVPGGDFTLKGHPDSSGFWGSFDDSLLGISGSVRADAAPCDAPIPPDTVVVGPQGPRACYSFTQIPFLGDTLTGSLAVEFRTGQSDADVYLRLDGSGSFTASTFYLAGTVGDESWIGFRIAPPPGMFGSRQVREASYDLHLLPAGVSSGPIMETLPESLLLGNWKGQSRACRESDFPG